MNLLPSLMLVARLLLLPLLMLPAGAFAVSLGDEMILSRLGDPVEVEIEVLQWEDMDLERVQISAASREEYDVFKLTWLPVLEHLNFNLVGPDLDGNVRVLISSRDPLDEPFLELLLVLRWPGGSLRREYVLLFDPPGPPIAVAQPAPAVVTEPAIQGEEEAAELHTAPPEQAPPAAEASPQVVALVAPSVPEAAVPAETAPQLVAPPVSEAMMPAEAPVTADVESNVAADAAGEELNAELPPIASEGNGATLPIAPADAGEAPAQTPPPQPEPVAEAAPSPPPIGSSSQPEPAAPDASPDARTQVAIEVEMLAPQRAATPVDTTRRTYQVRSGDSLWNIARQFRPAGAGENLYQMLLGIHDLNRNSFINGNISLLKANALLQMPSEADIAAIDAATAQDEFDRRWNAGTQRFDAVQRGEAIPLFVNEVPEDAPALPIEPELPPGTEAPPKADDEDGLIMVSATNAAQPLQLALVDDTAVPDEPVEEAEPLPAPPQADAADVANAADVADSADAPPEAAVDTSSPATSAVTTTTTIATTELETELAAMRARRESAEALARQLQESLKRAQAERAAQATLFGPENLPLAGGALALVLALIAGVVFMLKVAGDLRAGRVDGVMSPGLLRAEPMRVSHTRIEPKLDEPAHMDRSVGGKVEETKQKAVPSDATDATQIEVIELEAPRTTDGANATAANGLDDPDDLFARMDDMLDSEQKFPQK